ncbi:probable cytochrome P450 28a5 [Lutzomyia longipalpis]|uniref:probable cytochrome P450 28a5 n=1 Tax=Lutzomyia longipalpis TaxID=7200 RepID=UPI002483DB1C|nr:probable cytochrome P450 28a5 [Lutzomyia longipalpis]
MLIFLSIFFLIGYGIYLFLIWNYKHWEKRGIPFLEPKLICGNLPGILMRRHHIIYDLDNIYKQFKDKYSFVGIYNMREPQYLVTDASIVRDILISKFNNFQDVEYADMTDKKKDPILGNNPLLLKGEEWREKRAEITPAFTQLRIKAVYPLIEHICTHLKSFILKTDGHCVDVKEMCAMYGSDIISSCIFGSDDGALSSGRIPIRESGNKICPTSSKIKYFILLIQMIPSLKGIFKISIVDKSVEKYFVNLLKKAIELRKKSKINRMDYLSYLIELQTKKNLTILEMTSHCVSFFIEGFETSSLILTFALYHLGRNPDVQTKLRTEIEETIAKHGSISFEVAQEMPYLEQVLMETLRLYSPGVYLRKTCTESCELPLTPTKMMPIEKGYNIIIPSYSINRDSRYFEDPEKFNPDRFSPEKGGAKIYGDKGIFLPFGDGPRKCMGMNFGKAQLKAGIIAVIEEFEIEVDNKTPKEFVLNPKEICPGVVGKIWLRFKKIKG